MPVKYPQLFTGLLSPWQVGSVRRSLREKNHKHHHQHYQRRQRRPRPRPRPPQQPQPQRRPQQVAEVRQRPKNHEVLTKMAINLRLPMDSLIVTLQSFILPCLTVAVLAKTPAISWNSWIVQTAGKAPGKLSHVTERTRKANAKTVQRMAAQGSTRSLYWVHILSRGKRSKIRTQFSS